MDGGDGIWLHGLSWADEEAGVRQTFGWSFSRVWAEGSSSTLTFAGKWVFIDFMVGGGRGALYNRVAIGM